ncbi:MAG: 6-phosphogluconolactonase, partial [Verrucomicrobia bacterium]|nr:6-phosphogluconolactonase [Verrucomicrobiota bacterium]
RSQSHIYLPVKGPKPPPQRITLTYPVFAAAATACVLVTGKQKKAAPEESLKPDGQTPLAYLIRQRRHTLIITDFEVSQ